MENKRKIEVLKQVKDSISKNALIGSFICNHISYNLNWSEESGELIKWFQSTKRLVPNELKTNWIGSSGWWLFNEKENRIKYLDYLINILQNGNI